MSSFTIDIFLMKLKYIMVFLMQLDILDTYVTFVLMINYRQASI